MWKSTVGGRVLRFRLSGINNQNFLMRDEETGSWWQQVSGEAILGPLRGTRLEPMMVDLVSAELWRREHPDGEVRLGDPARDPEDYDLTEFRAKIHEVPVPASAAEDARLPPRELVAGIERDGFARAYPLAALAETGAIVDRLGDTELVLVVAGDGLSVRAFDRRLEDGIDGDRALELYRLPESEPPRLVDAASGSVFDFAGVAVEGPLAGSRLARLPVLLEFFFDWRAYHPDTDVYRSR